MPKYEVYSPLGPVERFVAAQLYELSKRLGILNPADQVHGALGGSYGYGQDFKNETFVMRSYSWADCTCPDDPDAGDEDHDDGCPHCAPNFSCGDFRLRWYKWIGRSMTANRPLEEGEARAMFERCMASLPKPTEEQRAVSESEEAAEGEALRELKEHAEKAFGPDVTVVLPENEEHRARKC